MRNALICLLLMAASLCAQQNDDLRKILQQEAKEAAEAMVNGPIAPSTPPASNSPDFSFLDKETPTPVNGSPNTDHSKMSLNLDLSELKKLQQAALMAGGRLEIQVHPIGITVSDMIIPLKRMGFDVVEDANGKIQVRTPNDLLATNARLMTLQSEINRLRDQRNRLLRDVTYIKPAIPELASLPSSVTAK